MTIYRKARSRRGTQKPPKTNESAETQIVKPLTHSYVRQTPETIRRRLSIFWGCNRDELMALIQDPGTTVGDIALASIIISAAREGDVQKLQFVLDRMVGKVVPKSDKIVEQESLKQIPTEKLLALIEGMPNSIEI